MWWSLLAGEQLGRSASHIPYPPAEPSRLLQACPCIGQLNVENALSSHITSANIQLARISHMTESGLGEEEEGLQNHRAKVNLTWRTEELRPTVQSALAQNQTQKQPK